LKTVLPDMIGGNAYIYSEGENIDFDTQDIMYKILFIYILKMYILK